MLRVRLLAACALAAAVGCSLVTDLSGYDGDAPGDAAAPGADALADVVTADSGRSEDATVDADVSGDGGSLDAGCIGMKISFCDDFERTTVKGAWDVAVEQNDGTVGIETVPGGSRRLRAQAVAKTSPPEPFALLRKSFVSATTSHYVVEADMEFAGYPTNAQEFRIDWKIKVDVTNGFQMLYLAHNLDNSFFTVQDFTTDPPLINSKAIAFSPGMKRRIRVDVTIGGQTKITVDGTQTHDYATPAYMVAGNATFEVGVTASPFPSSAFSMALDNLIFGAE